MHILVGMKTNVTLCKSLILEFFLGYNSHKNSYKLNNCSFVIQNASSSTSYEKLRNFMTSGLCDFSEILSKIFMYQPILIKVSMYSLIYFCLDFYLKSKLITLHMNANIIYHKEVIQLRSHNLTFMFVKLLFLQNLFFA